MLFLKGTLPLFVSLLLLYAFSQISTFLGKLRKAHPSKQINIFVKDFEEFKNLLHIADFRAIVTQCEQVCTLFNQVFRSKSSKTVVLTLTLPGNQQSGKSTNYTALAWGGISCLFPMFIPCVQLPGYVNSVLGSCQSYLLHREDVSNVFSGSKF